MFSQLILVHRHRLQLYRVAKEKLYEFTDTGKVIATRDLSEFGLKDPYSLVFAPSGDLTDDLSQMTLYICDSGPGKGKGQKALSLESTQTGKIAELSLTQPVVVAAT